MPKLLSHPQSSHMRERAMLDFSMLDDYLLPDAQEIHDLDAFDGGDYLEDVPAFRDAVAAAMIHNTIDDDMSPSVYGA